MSALAIVEPAPRAIDPVVAALDDLLATLDGWVEVNREGRDETSDADRIDRIARLEQVRAAVAATQLAECVRFAQSQVEHQLRTGVRAREVGQGIPDQIGLACHISPHAGSRRLGVARALWVDLPQTYSALTEGRLSERVAEIVVSETRHLDAPTRRLVDRQVVAAGIGAMGLRAAEACARRYAYHADRSAYLDRGRTERANRQVTVRPAPDTMSYLSGFLPVEQGVACYAALRQATDRAVAIGDPRSRGQIMADTLVERVTGQATAADVNVEVQITMSVETLLDPRSNRPATLAGHGPIPADLARHLLHSGHGQKWFRRLFTGPAAGSDSGGNLVGGDPTRRRFDGWLAHLIALRDQACRDPYCHAPIRHLDHISRHADGGPTTMANGRGVCARGNYVRELPGWHLTAVATGLAGEPHAVLTRTPTGHVYRSQAPDPP